MFTDRALKAMALAGPIQCIGCSCEVEYVGVSFRSSDLKVVGYRCACGAVVEDGIFMGQDTLGATR